MDANSGRNRCSFVLCVITASVLLTTVSPSAAQGNNSTGDSGSELSKGEVIAIISTSVSLVIGITSIAVAVAGIYIGVRYSRKKQAIDHPSEGPDSVTNPIQVISHDGPFEDVGGGQESIHSNEEMSDKLQNPPAANPAGDTAEQKTTLTELYKFYYKANGVGEELEMVVIPRLAKQWFKLGVNGFMLKEWEVNICQKPGADDEATCSELFQKFLRSGSKTYQCPILWKHIVEAINRADFKDCGTDLERALPFMVKK